MSYSEYQDPAISRYLKFGYWYQAHRYRLRKMLTVFFGVAASICWVAFFVYLVFWIQGRSSEQALFRSLVTDSIPVLDIHATRNALPLATGDVFAVSGASATLENPHTYDFGAFVTNPNAVWEITVEYRFVWDGGSTTKKIASVAPAADRVLAIRGVSAYSQPHNATLELLPINWRRISSTVMQERARNARSGLVLHNGTVDQRDGQTVLSYGVENKSVYVLHNVMLGFVLRSLNGSIAGYAEQSFETLLPGKSQTYEHVWLHPLSGGLGVEMIPLSPFLSDDEFSISEGAGITF